MDKENTYFSSKFNLCDFRIKKSDFIYLLNDFNGNTKIGRSNKPIERAKTISTSSNKLLFPTLIGIPIKDANKCESELHNLFIKNRLSIHGFKTEWFSVETYEIIHTIKPRFSKYFKSVIVFDPFEMKYTEQIHQGMKPKELEG
jgi:hypothetical protein